jgi:seipin
MVALYLLDSGTGSREHMAPHLPRNPYAHFDGKAVLFTSRRPAIIPYQDPIVSIASRILFILYHVLFSSSQTCTLVIPMAERITFPKVSAIPTSAYIEIQAGQTIQIYEASVTMTAQLRGLRWLMWHYRLPTFIVFTTLFWLCEVVFMIMAWLALSSLLQPTSIETGLVPVPMKKEGERGQENDLSDAPRSFPTYGRQPPLRYEPRVKEEGQGWQQQSMELPPAGAEADDEEDDDGESKDSWKGDSGIGTSYSEGGAGELRRRTSHPR